MDMTITLLPILVLLAALLTLIIVIDLRYQIIPDLFNAGLFVLGVAYVALIVPAAHAWSHIITAFLLTALGAFFAGPYSRWRKRDMLGWGDVKFFAGAGLWLPLEQLWLFLVMAGVLGTVGALLYRARTGRAETPFAPSLCISLFILVLHNSGYITLPWLADFLSL